MSTCSRRPMVRAIASDLSNGSGGAWGLCGCGGGGGGGDGDGFHPNLVEQVRSASHVVLIRLGLVNWVHPSFDRGFHDPVWVESVGNECLQYESTADLRLLNHTIYSISFCTLVRMDDLGKGNVSESDPACWTIDEMMLVINK
ncbi:hypothetical protein An02g12890 [Aspergillus niger]|uniref:Uncharacterized protein n=2 Tax=Aspergillus niger TaxID=5061 RepID=A2QF09_ASPNC|nr:hypothetical protein An02g12890 [Aspergillus niger]CAK37917.1 hypothetical protein An02g12890 [Aspergillus niger]